MLAKLAARNVRRSFRDYGVYLLTLTFGVCLFYTFNSLDGQGAMIYLAQAQNPIVESIWILMDVFSVFVAVVLSCLILYANRFLLRRRKRELGTYLLLGLDQGRVSRLLFLETGAVGLISLAAGLVLGVFASLGMSALTLSMFQLDVSGMLGLTFSPRAAGKTALYFCLIFLLVMAFSAVQVSRSKLIDLIQAGRKNEEMKERPASRAAAELVLGLLCLGAAYFILLYFGMALAVATPFLCWPMLGLGSLGTFLIFHSLSGFVLSSVRRRSSFYYKGLRLFTLRQWLSQVRTSCASQTVICILLLLAIGITASAMGLNSTLDALTDGEAPADVTLWDYYDPENGDAPLDFDALLREGGFDLAARLSGRAALTLYRNDPEVTGCDEPVPAVLSLSGCNEQLALLGRPPIALAPGEYLLLEESPLNGASNWRYLVVEDEVVRDLEAQCFCWSANYAGWPEETERAMLQLIKPHELTHSVYWDSRLAVYQDVMGNKLLALFLGLYLGFTFLLAAAAVLALQQLSQAADNAGRYDTLRRLGAEENMLSRSAGAQVALAFLLPLGLALVHSFVGMKAANDLIAQAGRVDSAASVAVTALVLLAVYGGYFLATAAACGRMARKG